MQKVNFFIDGHSKTSVSGETFITYSPSSGEPVAEVAKGTREDARLAIHSANKNKDLITSLSVWDRSMMLRNIADSLERKKEEVAWAVSLEQGKPYYSEALIEVQRAIEGFGNASEHIKWLETSVISVKDPTKRVWTIRQPKGVYGVITPWNMPINIPVEYIAPGLATGNAIVWLPSASVSYCASKLMECIIEADIPPGIVNFITGPGEEVGDEIVTNSRVNGICFTGSSQTGSIISKRGSEKEMILELGGNGPTIIFEDAKIGERELNAIASACFMNGGQICTATGRILVHQSSEEEVVAGLVNYAKSLVVGESFDKNATMGPLHMESVCKKMDDHIRDSLSKGGEIAFGGKRIREFKTTLFYEPTVIRNVHADALANCDETFGPIAPIVTFSSDQELREIINKSNAGLSSAVFTADMSRAIRVAEEMKTGVVNINDRSNYWELHIPFGGVSGKHSGRGKIGGMKILEEMTDLKMISMTIK